ncbi:MAG: glycosyltransferase family 9 protein, partial [Gemmatimonadetes bacterium]|nr:glycosyltransferase family 9 protein [Gemmatimonadota bacterium]
LPVAAPRRSCIVLLSGSGDVVHGLPLALDLKRLDPAIHVTWVAEPGPAQVLAHHPAVDRVVVYRTRDGVRGLWELRRAMSDVDAHLALNLQRYLKSAWPTLLSGAGIRVGLPPSKTRDGIRWIHTHVLPEGPWKHTQDLFLDFRWALGVERDAPVSWDLALSPEEEEERHTWFDALGPAPVAALVVASANPKKDWIPERFAELSDALDRDLGFRVILLGGPSPREHEVVARILRAAASHPLDALAGSVRTLMARLKGSSLVVSPDTGPLHLAHAMGVPVVGLFGHTNPWRVGPWRDFRDLVVDRYTHPGDGPDPSAYLPREGRMGTITVPDVLEKVELARCRYL